MRPYLLDFLIEAHAAFQLLPETLFLAINLLDRYCSKRVVYKRHYQLVGCASLLIAAKYGDKKERVPTIRELKSMCCSLYDEEMFTQMEWHVLNTLDWMVGHPTVDAFLTIALFDEYADHAVEHMAWYICEIALYHKEFVSTKPSVMARTSLALARMILGRQEVDSQSSFDHVENLTLVSLSHQLNRPSQVLSKKYSGPHMSCTSTSLERFLEQQAAISRRTTPPSPPSEPSIAQPKPLTSNYNGYHTPLKSQTVHGYPTPPITPDTEYFAERGYSRSVSGRSASGGCPMTPSPLNSHPFVQPNQPFYQPNNYQQQDMLHP